MWPSSSRYPPDLDIGAWTDREACYRSVTQADTEKNRPREHMKISQRKHYTRISEGLDMTFHGLAFTMCDFQPVFCINCFETDVMWWNGTQDGKLHENQGDFPEQWENTGGSHHREFREYYYCICVSQEKYPEYPPYSKKGYLEQLHSSTQQGCQSKQVYRSDEQQKQWEWEALQLCTHLP